MAEKKLPRVPPAMSISLTIEPASFTVNEGNKDLPVLAITATSHAKEPITIFTSHTIFNLSLAQSCESFTCFDLTAARLKRMESTGGRPRRYPYDRTKGTSDDKYFITWEPGASITFKEPFALARWGRALLEGHRYQLRVSEDEEISYWWYGRRKDVMASRSVLEWLKLVRKRRHLLKASGEPIDLSSASRAEFEILQTATP